MSLIILAWRVNRQLNQTSSFGEAHLSQGDRPADIKPSTQQVKQVLGKNMLKCAFQLVYLFAGPHRQGCRDDVGISYNVAAWAVDVGGDSNLDLLDDHFFEQVLLQLRAYRHHGVMMARSRRCEDKHRNHTNQDRCVASSSRTSMASKTSPTGKVTG